ncbi:M48 family metallopeptidase [Shouchella tritolerans]|uniref:M48 family metallopeptidase n=1 Tax=Shouchella tritolerans TaxID=2979466 RepID=UPI0021E97A61|nr:M48 family metallopeptidase [Shouchella tritolerans]
MNESTIQSPRETPYFIICLLFSILVYLLAVISVIGIGIVLAVFAVLYVTQLLATGSIRGNGVRIHEHQFGDVYERVVVISKKMGVEKVPDVFVIEAEGLMNAFATRFWGKHMILLTSDVFDLAREAGEAELDFIIAHELTHIKRNHVWKNVLIAPAKLIPFLAQAYSRSCEYTCDRAAAYFTGNVAAAKRALAIFSVGKRLAPELSEEAFRQQIETDSNGAIWLSEVLSTHPRLPKRIQSIAVFANEQGANIYRQKSGVIALGVGLIVVVGALMYGAVLLSIVFGSIMYGSFADELDPSFSSGYEQLNDWSSTDTTNTGSSVDRSSSDKSPLFQAVIAEDNAKVKQLLQTGDFDVNETDSSGNSLLYHATFYENKELVELLLEAGADPNDYFQDDSPLVSAVYYNDYETALLLLDYGADPYYADSYGDSALSLMEAENEEELRDKLVFYAN